MYKRYRHLVIEDADEPPTRTELQIIENRLGATLPQDFVHFFAVANGASLHNYFLIVPLSPQPEALCFGRMFTTKSNVKPSFISDIDEQRRLELIPEKVLPFARDGGASYLYLDLRQTEKSPVMAFVHGLPSWTGLRHNDTLVQISDSFTAYTDLLKFDVEYAKQRLQEALMEQNKPRIAANIEFLDLALPNWRSLFNIADI